MVIMMMMRMIMIWGIMLIIMNAMLITISITNNTMLLNNVY